MCGKLALIETFFAVNLFSLRVSHIANHVLDIPVYYFMKFRSSAHKQNPLYPNRQNSIILVIHMFVLNIYVQIRSVGINIT